MLERSALVRTSAHASGQLTRNVWDNHPLRALKQLCFASGIIILISLQHFWELVMISKLSLKQFISKVKQFVCGKDFYHLQRNYV